MTEWNRSVSDASRNVGMLEFHATKRIWLYKWFQSFSIQVQKTSVGNHPIPRLGRRQPPCTMNPTGTHVCSYLSLWLHQPWIFDMPIIMSWHVMSCTVMWCDAMVCLYVRTYVCMYVINIHVIYIYMVPCPVFPPPPHGMGGGYDAPVVVYIHTYLPTYVHTYIHTITLPYLTLPYLTLPYLTFHTYIHTYIHTIPYLTLPYQHTNIPTYHHHRPQGGGPEEPYHHHRPQGGGPEEPYHHHRPQGGGQKNQTILSTHTHWWGGEGGWPTLHHIYIYMQRLGVAPALQRRGFPFPIKCCCNFTFNWEDQQRY